MSISKVAEKAGVSHATVSRVINQRSGVAEGTVQRVLQAMEELGYSPPRAANRQGPTAAARGVRTGNIALLWSSSPVEATGSVGMALIEGVSEGASENGLNLMVGYLREERGLPGMLDSRQIDGLILHGPEVSAEQAEVLRRFPAVWMLSSGNQDWGDRVQPDHQAAARDVLDAFLAAGRRRVACLSNSSFKAWTRAFSRRADAFREEALERGLEPLILIDDSSAGIERYSAGRASEMLREAFARQDRPEALFVANDLYLTVVQELTRLGLKPGQDVLLARCNRGPEYVLDEIERPFVVDIRSELIGQLAVQQLLWRIAHPDVPGQVRMQVSPVTTRE